MGLFGSRSRRTDAPFLPPGTEQRIVAFGQAAFNHTGNVDDYTLEPDMYRLLEQDRDRFFQEMVALSLHGGWLAFGVEKLVVSVAGGNLDHPAYDKVMEAALQFLRSSGVPANRLNGYESQYWHRRHPGEQW